MDGVSDIEKQLNNKIKFKLNRLKERLGHKWDEFIYRTNSSKDMSSMRQAFYTYSSMDL
jgi:hypothetical protein